MTTEAAPRVLALDFDGVIWDSAPECFETGWRTYQKLFKVDLSGAQNKSRFLAGRPLARTGHDFYLLLYLLDRQPQLDLASFPFDELVKLRARFKEQARAFDAEFYVQRAKYREEDLGLWLSWQGPYPKVVELLDRWEASFEGVALATTKDRQSAAALLKTIGRSWPIFGKEFSLEKDRQLEGIAAHFSVNSENIIFVDDLVENLEQVRSTRASSVLASWGYNTLESREEAKRRGYPVLDVLELEELFRTSFPGV